jgi:phage-related protein (TIGR01555 family)
MAKKVKNKKEEIVTNGLSEAIMGYNPGGIGTQVNQTDTLFINERWYLISNMRQILSQAYAEHGLVQTVVDVPVDDGLRGGVEVKSKQLSEEELHQLAAVMDRQDDVNIVGQAMKWNRLYGGAGIVIITDQDPETPLDVSAIKKDSALEFRAVDMWELFWDKQNTEAFDPSLQEHKFTHYSYYGTKLHKSRVLRMKGIIAPSFIRPRLRGWGLSVIESLVAPINQYFKTNNVCFEVIDEFKLDIFKIKNLTTTLMSSTGTAQVQQRVQLANMQKNFQNALTMDSEDDYIQKQLSFSGIAEILEQIRMQIACSVRMPMSKIFGISSVGFSSGEDDIENYNAMVESQIRSKCKYDILRVVEIRCQKMFGFIPDDLEIYFKPLRILSSVDEETVKTQKFNRLYQAKSTGEISQETFNAACNKDNLLGVKVDDVKGVDVQEDEAVESDEDEEIPEANKTFMRTYAVSNDDGKFYEKFLNWLIKKNYFTKEDQIKIPFEPKKHKRKKDGTFEPTGAGPVRHRKYEDT